MISIEALLYQTERNGNKSEVARLSRLLERLDQQRAAYGKAQRGESR
jgi:hypothetical protein